ncbi:MAG TPA: UDP-N-acetylglucosamine 2-epimerase (non-hydrolyzing) [Solirubrobacterales bacterium]|nr:UDP-N-acetylglucosamine 2-epimerase (non-hydrolyzing) [Solirubrobacterales bacterium]
MTRVLAVVGARPNFVKMAPVTAALTEREGVEVRLLHTGQHYDRALSDGFIDRLGMPQPDANLGVGSGSHAEQTAKVLVGVEADLLEHPAELVLVAGDVNSTMATALAATKLHVKVAHVESGLRSRDWTMPEEVNRVVTDRVSDVLLCTSEDAVENLAAEGIGDGVELVGNTMIDSLFRILADTDRAAALEAAEVESRGYVLVTLHRPALVDDRERLGDVLEVLGEISHTAPVLFPAHPRTVANLERWGLELPPLVRLARPLDYAEFIALEGEARLVITDSGGVQEETTVLGVPCLTYRDSTERPITVTRGTNELVGVDPGALRDAASAVLAEPPPSEAPRIPLWDGQAGPRAGAAVAAALARA